MPGMCFPPSSTANWIFACSQAVDPSKAEARFGVIQNIPKGQPLPSSPLGRAADWRSLEGMAHPGGHPGSWGSFQTMFRKGVQELLKWLIFKKCLVLKKKKVSVTAKPKKGFLHPIHTYDDRGTPSGRAHLLGKLGAGECPHWQLEHCLPTGCDWPVRYLKVVF